MGRDGGRTATNCQKTKPVNGACNNSQRNACSSGTANDAVIADTSTHHTWHCVGTNGGTTATNCQKARPAGNGLCDNSLRNSCLAGTANAQAVPDTQTHYRWQCDGINGGRADTCQIAIAVNGVCNNSVRNSCSAGTANDAAIVDTSTHYTWHCVGRHGGITATNCQIAKPPVNGACDNTERNGCSAGTANDPVLNWHSFFHGNNSNLGCLQIIFQKNFSYSLFLRVI